MSGTVEARAAIRDVDIDTDIVVQTSPNQPQNAGAPGAWARYWDGRRDLWKTRDDRLVARH